MKPFSKKLRSYFFILLATGSLTHLEGSLCTPQECIVKRVYSHLLIGDPISAQLEAQQGLQLYPQNKLLAEAHIKSLAKLGDEKGMLAAWNHLLMLYPEELENRNLIESMAWGTIAKGSDSSSPVIRTIALLGAFFGQDAKGVTILHRHLDDQNSFSRGVAIQLCAHLRDAKLCEKVLQIFQQERNWKVRLLAIQAVGAMKVVAAKSSLLAIISDKNSSAEEKNAATQALVEMLDTIEGEEIANLAASNRAGLRALACQLIAHLDLEKHLNTIYPLLKDCDSGVRTAAMQTFGSLCPALYKKNRVDTIAAAMLQDPDYTVAITAAWALTLSDPCSGQKAFKKWLYHDSKDVCRLASSALSATGKYAQPLALQVFREHQDPYVRINLALGLLGQRIEINAACTVLCQELRRQKKNWMWSQKGAFCSVVPSTISHDANTNQAPEVANQLVRLEVLNAIAMMKHPQAQEAIAYFLQQKGWGITGLASVLLLTEGDESSLDLVENLLLDPNDKVRTQAALILALWGRDERAITTLQHAYSGAERELKEKILEGIGRIGAPSSIPFLIERLQDPFQSLRIIAASALLQCLYH